MAAAHAVARAAHLDAERRHDELLVGVVRPRATEMEEALEVEARLLGIIAEHLDDLADVVALIAGAHRRVRGEDGPLARGGERLVT